MHEALQNLNQSTIEEEMLKREIQLNDGLHTLLCEVVESIINDRAITKTSDDPNNLEALTICC